MKIKTLEIAGFIGCLESLRLPFKKECRSVSSGGKLRASSDDDGNFIQKKFHPINTVFGQEQFIDIHENDLKLLQRLIKSGDEHSKSVRLINVTTKITAPLFWWSEENTYTQGVTRGCSESTMHTLKKEKLTQSNFESEINPDVLDSLQFSIDQDYDVADIKSDLPSGYLQTRVINYNYQTLRRIWLQRREHRLPQWHIFLGWVNTLPLAKELILIE